ncbi:MAG: hypothetical protein QGH42_07845 [Kiritimatiellia bacterium]|jgi:hypothetical protein|nr:hypothetical protein [Kiritimatiellia bacterium]MDP6630286.1 hypothetical protein [Kiritimatiellia bacterium]MDP6810793.1 hypothetical protein [Kiritimatiellia bacterium]MDP7024135.1 hypothetical protein [Kiritimatiellia bacterium]
MKRCAEFVLTVLTMAVVASGAYLESDGDRPAIKPGPSVPPVRPAPDVHLPTLAQRVTVGAAHRWSGLTFYPLELPASHSVRRILTLDQALQRGELTIREVGEGRVAHLELRNDANLPVFLMAGELIVGGKQNRMVRNDVLLPRQSNWLEVEVYCGEQHRWKGSGGFKSGGTLSAPALRRMASGGAGQDRIWGEIGSQLKAAEVESETANYQRFFENGERRRRLDSCVERLRPLPGPRTVGCVVVGHHRIVGCDLFDDPDLFASLWPKLSRSYGADVVLPRPPIDLYSKQRRIAPLSAKTVRRFLDRVGGARFTRRPTPGSGKLWSVQGQVEGTSLEHFGGVIHASLFPARMTIQPLPQPRIEE